MAGGSTDGGGRGDGSRLMWCNMVVVVLSFLLLPGGTAAVFFYTPSISIVEAHMGCQNFNRLHG
jgi:hypothetical protein